MCIIRSMYADVPNHEPSLMLMNCGDGRLQRPSMGSWITYGLGSENQNLPGFIAMCPGGYPIVATQNWRSAFLPGAYQGTYIDTQHTEIDKLIENIRNDAATPAEQRQQLDLVRRLNERHAAARAHDPALESRIQSFELAYRMQGEAATRLTSAGSPSRSAPLRTWHAGPAAADHAPAARAWSALHPGLERRGAALGRPRKHRRTTASSPPSGTRPIAAFLTDLKQCGLFDQVLVFWGGEFGRTPVAELPALSGRDHNHYGFSMWLAGGGVRGGHVHGATDELGFAAICRQGSCSRPPRHDPPSSGLRPREAHLSLRRP